MELGGNHAGKAKERQTKAVKVGEKPIGEEPLRFWEDRTITLSTEKKVSKGKNKKA